MEAKLGVSITNMSIRMSIGSRWIAHDRMCCSLQRAMVCFSGKMEPSSWAKLIDAYTRAAMIHPLDPMIAFAGPAHEVGEHGRIIRSRDGGANWELASDGLKPPMDDMVEVFVSDPRLPDTVFAICSEGRLLYSNVRKVNWQVVECEAIVQCLDFVEQA
jgi:hypothetical protein